MYSNNDVKVIIHRGTHQIGGCCTEIATDTTRILIDFGANLSNDSNQNLDIDGVTNNNKKCDGIFVSHYHSDHIGELSLNNQSVPVYMTARAVQIQELFQKHSNGKHMNNISFCNMKIMYPGVWLSIGDIRILPIESEHSALEPLMFFIETNGKRILHTGDFRMHGLHWNKVQDILNHLPKLDLMITEGTTLSRTEGNGWTEDTVKMHLQTILNKHKYCFFLSSSSNISRLETFAMSIPRGKYFLMDSFQRDLLRVTGSSVFDKAIIYGENLKLEQQGFGMIIRANNHFSQIVRKYLALYPEETCLIYSMWSGYLEKESIKQIYNLPFIHKYLVHSSGHVVFQDLNYLLNMLSPKKIVIIHTEELSFQIDLRDRIVPLNDKEVLYI